MNKRTGSYVAGFTMIEAMVVISLMGILLAMAVPSFKDSSLSGQLRSTANELLSSANLARSEAIMRNTPVTLCASSNGRTCSAGGWQRGWIVKSGATVIFARTGAPRGLMILAAGDATTLDFQPTGVGATAAAFTICRAGPRVGAQERVLTLTATGRASVRTTNAGMCSGGVRR